MGMAKASSSTELIEVRVAKEIAGGATPYSANDVVNDTTCTTTATAWLFTNMARTAGGYFKIHDASIFSESENIEPRLTLMLFNATPTGALADNVANTNPLPADRTKYLKELFFPALSKITTSVASIAVASGSTVGNLPLTGKCAAGSTTVYGVLKTLDIFTQTATDDIEIVLQVEWL